MKKLFILLSIITILLIGGCNAYDDSKLVDRVENLEERVIYLEQLCDRMNTNIIALQGIVSALQENDFIKSVTPITKDGQECIGYTVTFTKGDPITIYNGTNGTSPAIGAERAEDGFYYWTLNGEWLTGNDGSRIKAQGSDGTNGKEAITPKLKVEEGVWFVSYDNGTTWSQISEATGTNGNNLFKSVEQGDTEVVFTLADSSTIVIPIIRPLGLVFDQTENIGILADETAIIEFGITGGSADTRLGVIATNGWQVSISKNEDNVSGQITVTVTDPSANAPISVWVSDDSHTLFYSLSFMFEQRQVNVKSSTNIKLSHRAQTFSISVDTNTDYDITIPDDASSWLSRVGSRALRTETSSFSVETNPNSESRTTTLSITSEVLAEPIDVELLQAGMPDPTVNANATELVIPSGGITGQGSSNYTLVRVRYQNNRPIGVSSSNPAFVATVQPWTGSDDSGWDSDVMTTHILMVEAGANTSDSIITGELTVYIGDEAAPAASQTINVFQKRSSSNAELVSVFSDTYDSSESSPFFNNATIDLGPTAGGDTITLNFAEVHQQEGYITGWHNGVIVSSTGDILDKTPIEGLTIMKDDRFSISSRTASTTINIVEIIGYDSVDELSTTTAGNVDIVQNVTIGSKTGTAWRWTGEAISVDIVANITKTSCIDAFRIIYSE